MAIVTSNHEHSIILHRFPSSHSSLSTTSSDQNTKWEAKFKKASKPIIVPARGIEEIYFEFKKIYDDLKFWSNCFSLKKDDNLIHKLINEKFDYTY